MCRLDGRTSSLNATVSPNARLSLRYHMRHIGLQEDTRRPEPGEVQLRHLQRRRPHRVQGRDGHGDRQRAGSGHDVLQLRPRQPRLAIVPLRQLRRDSAAVRLLIQRVRSCVLFVFCVFGVFVSCLAPRCVFIFFLRVLDTECVRGLKRRRFLFSAFRASRGRVLCHLSDALKSTIKYKYYRSACDRWSPYKGPR